MIIRDKKKLLWFLRFGKVKACVFYFIFIITIYALVNTIFAVISSFFTGADLLQEIQTNELLNYFVLVYAGYMSWHFYDDAVERLNNDQKLKQRNLTEEDIKRIAFTKNWAETRKKGAVAYCLYDGGLIAGMLLLIPVSFIMFSVVAPSNRLFDEFKDLTLFIGQNIIICYVAGCILYSLRWTYNERKFTRLTTFIP
ncbi:hypothetical protein GCM10023149_52310 [Mucilaginibacter gynuensis]|uniref:RDD family protein n=1 Tax=Mucilaginibacter gynuensis TaxID=1302236 RepID=A0ABP8HKP1_9SPHI